MTDWTNQKWDVIMPKSKYTIITTINDITEGINEFAKNNEKTLDFVVYFVKICTMLDKYLNIFAKFPEEIPTNGRFILKQARQVPIGAGKKPLTSAKTSFTNTQTIGKIISQG